jgi:tRNA G18 (ribose-2'-O)-methylase SpoU
MKNKNFLIRQCINPDCCFRFPAPDDSGIGINCPKCKTITEIIHKINLNTETTVTNTANQKKINCEVLLDNIRSTFNVGAIFRSADGVGIRKIHLCGITPSPTNIKVHKTSLGSENTIQHEIHRNAVAVVQKFKQDGYRIWAIEKTNYSKSVFNFELNDTSEPTLMILGNEIIGVDPDILALCDNHLHIPMLGLKNSLNVAIAFGIAAYSLTQDYFINYINEA